MGFIPRGGEAVNMECLKMVGTVMIMVGMMVSSMVSASPWPQEEEEDLVGAFGKQRIINASYKQCQQYFFFSKS
jgi:hypothetical protein